MAEQITPLPPAPSRQNPGQDFVEKSDAFVAALPGFVTEANALASEAETNAQTAEDAKDAALGINALTNYKGEWASGTTYATGDSVVYSGNFYISNADGNVGVTPPGGDWQITLRPKGIIPNTVSGSTPSLNLDKYDFFEISAADPVITFTFNTTETNRRFVLLVKNRIDERWDIPLASYSQSFSISTQDASPTGIFFKPDGAKMYIIGDSGKNVYEYDLSSAWDISSASYLQDFSVLPIGSGTSTEGLFFKPDGTKMYVVLRGTFDDVNEYDLSTAWDVSSASYSQNFSISSQETSPKDLFFKDDGTKMYVIGSDGDAVYEYDLSSAWDISSASYQQNFSVSAQETFPTGLFFKPDGTKMYVVGATGDAVYDYDLSTPWDVSSASYSQNFSVSSQDTIPSGVSFKPDGTKMYIVGDSNNNVYEYDFSYRGTLVFPVEAEIPSGFQEPYDDLFVLEFVTTDGGTTYTCINVQKGSF